jgi:hypothetical protein
VCPSTKNLEILIDNNIELYGEDTNKKTPLIWAVEAKKSAEHIKLILENIDY